MCDVPKIRFCMIKISRKLFSKFELLEKILRHNFVASAFTVSLPSTPDQLKRGRTVHFARKFASGPASYDFGLQMQWYSMVQYSKML